MALNKDDLILVSSSKYDLYAKLLSIANQYTDVNNEDFLKTGLFGYITESMAMIARDSSFHKTMLYNESFLNTAVIPKSIYNWAKMFNVNVTNATPSYADILVTISEEDIEDKSKVYSTLTSSNKYGQEVLGSGQRRMVILDRENPFIVGDLNFTLEKSILIYKDTTGNSYVVKYCGTEVPTTQYYDPDTLFVKSNVTKTDGRQYITFIIRAFQYKVNKVTKAISSSSFLDTKIHKFTFTDQFVGAKLRYRKGNIEEDINLKFSNIDEIVEDEKFGYFNIIDEDKLQISFSSEPGRFLPSVNSTLLLDIYTTKGSSGNITFSGDVIFRLREESLRNLPIVASLANQQSIGGIDAPSLDRIKNTIINEISTRDVIVTESDLNNYFLVLTSLLETVNDGKIVFIKKRDDILRRVFSSYILMRDGLDIQGNLAGSNYVSNTIPTNTITADFQISDNISKPFGTIIKRKSETLEEYEYVPSNALDGSDDYYIIPFYTRVNLTPFRKVKYVYNLTDDSTSLSYKEITSASSERYVIPSAASVKRGLEGTNSSNFYNFEFDFVTNFNMSTEVSPKIDEFIVSFFRRGNETTPISNLSFFKDEGLTINSVVDPNDATLFNTKMTFSIAVQDEEFNFSTEEASGNYGTFINLTHNNKNISLPEDVKVNLEFNNVMSERLSIVFSSDSFLSLFRNLDDLMYSDVVVNKLTPRWNQISNVTFSASQPTVSVINGDYWINTGNSFLYQFDGTTWVQITLLYTASATEPVPANNAYWFNAGTTPATRKLFRYTTNTYITSVTIKDIPVVHASFFSSEANQTKFIKQLFVYIDMLKENIGKLETNTFFDLKFYNTFGESQYYNTLRTNVKLELDVYVNEKTSELELAIKDYVRILVDNANSQESLKVSTLIKDLSQQFPDIDHIDFKGLNGTFNQYIKQTDTLAKNLFAPEYLNISREDLESIVVIQM